MPVKDTIQSRRGSSAQWSAANPILADGEIGYDSTTKQMKVGDGVTAWNALAYSDISATNLTTGTLPDARLSSKVKSLADLATPASTSLLAMNSSGAVVEDTSLLGLGNVKVTQKSANSGGTWGPMDGAMIAFLGNSAYLFGGWAGDPYNADWTGGTVTNLVYRSNNFGATWVRIRDHDLTPDSTHFTPCHTASHTKHTVSGTEYIYLMEGDVHDNGAGPGTLLTGDTRRTTDGITWTKVNSVAAGWATICLAASGSLNGNLYRVGGVNTPGGTADLVNANNVRSVWRSTDNGVTWTNLGNAPWPVGQTQDRLPLHNGKLWRIGGGTYDNDGSLRTYDNSVWSFDGTTWTEVLANGLAPWAARTFANTFSFGGWLWLVRGVNYTSGNLTDTWRSRDGITWIETDLGAISDKASHADGLAVHATGFLVASGNGYLEAVTPVNTDSPSFFVEIEDDKTSGVVDIASNRIEAMRPLDVGISVDGYTESSNPRALTPGNNAKVRQILVPNFHEGQPDKSIIGAYVANGTTFVYLGGGLDSSKECAQDFSVYLGSDNVVAGDRYFRVNLSGSWFKENALGVGVENPVEGINLQAHHFFIGADEANNNNRSASTNKIAKIQMPSYSGSTFVQVFGGYSVSGQDILFFGGGLSLDNAATKIEFYVGATQGESIGTRKVRITSSGLEIDQGGTMKLIEVGAADSGGTGYRMLRIAN